MVIRAPCDLAVIVAEKQNGHALTFTLATHSPWQPGLGNKLRPASHQPLFPVIAAIILPFGMHDVDRPMGRGMQGPGAKFSQ
ncbi:hypothetical protein [Mycobacterium avium]